MKYAGMPMGMWVLFSESFRKQLTDVFGYDRAAERISCGNTPSPPAARTAIAAIIKNKRNAAF